jgi:serine/threonine protein kinase
MSAPTIIAGRYEIGERIGEGGMGAVHRGVDLRANRPVAIKRLKPDVIAAEPTTIERFRREADALRRLNHPNIVRVFALLNENETYYIVMEYIEGGSLLDAINRRGRLPVEQTLSIALELSDALARAHHLNIIHRDIKSANVLLGSDGAPRLTDFGVAHIGDRSRLTKAQSVLGTLSYLSPEALDGPDVDVRADIWAMGVLIYEMLIGELPFDEPTTGATIAAIVFKQLPDVMTLRNDIPPQLAILLNAMLQKKPEQRIDSARLVGAELQALMQGKRSTLGGLRGDSVAAEVYDSAVVQSFMDEVAQIANAWEQKAITAEKKSTTVQVGDQRTVYFQRGIAQAYRDALRDLDALLTNNQQSLGAGRDIVKYIPVKREKVELLFKRAKIQLSSLYLDNENIFTAIFPNLLSIKLDKRLDQIHNALPGVIVIDSGTVPDTYEPFIDFGFNEDPPLS